MNTRITYLYRDADNYKKWNSAVISGEMTAEQEKHILDSLDDNTYFVPSQVGLPEEKFGAETDADHPWFEWEGFEHTADSITLNTSVEELVKRFVEAANGWEAQRESPAAGVKPYVVTVRETLSRTIIIWAEDRLDAEKIAYNLCNASEIELMGDDFIDRQCTCDGAAGQGDFSSFKQYRRNQ